jgi:hypothetical protein
MSQPTSNPHPHTKSHAHTHTLVPFPVTSLCTHIPVCTAPEPDSSVVLNSQWVAGLCWWLLTPSLSALIASSGTSRSRHPHTHTLPPSQDSFLLVGYTQLPATSLAERERQEPTTCARLIMDPVHPLSSPPLWHYLPPSPSGTHCRGPAPHLWILLLHRLVLEEPQCCGWGGDIPEGAPIVPAFSVLPEDSHLFPTQTHTVLPSLASQVSAVQPHWGKQRL